MGGSLLPLIHMQSGHSHDLVRLPSEISCVQGISLRPLEQEPSNHNQIMIKLRTLDYSNLSSLSQLTAYYR